MKPEEQRIAIAGVCGWKKIPDGRWNLDGKVEPFLPDYLNDLNAMYEAEKVLVNIQWGAYGEHLRRLCDKTTSWPYHATASQKAEAFLKTLNLWTE